MEKGIEANLDQIKVIVDIQSPRSVKEIQKLMGRATTLSRFLSRLTDKCEKCETFFNVIKRARAIV